jgi:hypothetical protein
MHRGAKTDSQAKVEHAPAERVASFVIGMSIWLHL